MNLRFLHTSDWHLGRSLEGRSRIGEQEAFVEEIIEIANDYQVDAILLAGDIFDGVNPPAMAEQLFYYALDGLSAGGKRGVVVIAGNHDSPDRLMAANPLGQRQGIALLGGFETIQNKEKSNSLFLHSGRCWLEMVAPAANETAVLLTLPYPSEARLQELLTASLDDEQGMALAYSQKIETLLGQLSFHFKTSSVNMIVSHLLMLGGMTSDSERPIFSVGGASLVSPKALPFGSQYVALGHLHRPQFIRTDCTVCRYSGSPLAYSFSEAGQAKSVTIVDVKPGLPAKTQEIFLNAGRPLARWQAYGGIPQVYHWLEERRDSNAWIDLEIYLDTPLTTQEIQALRKCCERFVEIRPVYPKLAPEDEIHISRQSLTPEQLFIQYYARKFSCAPDERLVALFMELMGEQEEKKDTLELGDKA